MSNPFEQQQKTILKRLRTGMVSSLFARLGVTALAFLLQLLLARIMGSVEYGIYVYLLSWIMIGTQLVTAGFDVSLLKFSSSYHVNSQWGLVKGLWSFANRVTLIAGCTLSFGYILLLYLFNALTPLYFSAALLVPVLGLSTLRQSMLQSFKRVVVAVIPNGYFKPLALATSIVLFTIATGKKPDAVHVMVTHLLMACLTVMVGSLLVNFLLLPQKKEIKVEGNSREWLSVSFPLLIVSSIILIQNQTDVIMLGLLANKEAAGIYAVAARLAEVVSYGLVAVNTIFSPICAELFEKKNKPVLQAVITRSARLSFLFALITGSILCLANEHILGFFGTPFLEGKAPLILLIVGQLFNAAAGSVGMIMAMTKHQQLLARISCISLAVNIILNGLLIPIFGLIGAAAATACSIVIWNGIAYHLIKSNEGLCSSIAG